MTDIENALDAVTQIKVMANEFEGKYLPIDMVGAIEGYCNRIERCLLDLRQQTYRKDVTTAIARQQFKEDDE